VKEVNSFVIHSAAVPDKRLSLGACSTVTRNFLIIRSEAYVSANFLGDSVHR